MTSRLRSSLDNIGSVLFECLPRLRILALHSLEERTWNADLAAIVKSVQVWLRPDPPVDYPPGVIADVQVGSETDLRAAELRDGTRFFDTPTQVRLATMVVKRKKGAGYTYSPADRGLTGMYIPDMLTRFWQLEPSIPPNPPKRLHVLTVIGEIKVTRLTIRNGRCVVVNDPRDDPDMDDLEDSTAASFYSLGSGGSTAIVEIDTNVKWREGLAKALIYLQSAFEYCRCVLGHVVISSSFSRLYHAGDQVFIECSDSYLASRSSGERNGISIRDFLSANNSSHLRWSLSRRVDAGFDWDPNGPTVLAELHHLGLQVLVHHTRTHPTDPFVPLVQNASVTFELQSIINELRDPQHPHTVSVEMPSSNLDIIAEFSRPKREPRTARAAKPRGDNPPPPDDAADDKDGRGNGKGKGKGKGKRTRNSASKGKGTTALARTSARLRANAAAKKRTTSTKVTTWLDTIPSSDATIPELEPPTRMTAPPSSELGSPPSEDELGEALEATDMVPPLADVYDYYEDEDKKEQKEVILGEDVVAAAHGCGPLLVLVTSEQMDTILRAVAVAVSV